MMPRKRKRTTKAPAFIREYQRRQRQLDDWLSAQLTDWLGYEVEVRVKRMTYKPSRKLPGDKVLVARKHAPVEKEDAVAELMKPTPLNRDPLDDDVDDV